MERRKFVRYEVLCKVKYWKPGNAFRKYSTQSFNISLGGIGIKLNNLFVGAKELDLLIYAPFQRLPIRAKGRLVWHDESNERAGIQFTNIPWTSLKTLIRQSA
ncbi:MAG: PilZ domain-containing protein [Candidatus Omnitrophica bacterium]|nr:PilZ domain-containing protein [Candidatus Omnitrophota bacterium]